MAVQQAAGWAQALLSWLSRNIHVLRPHLGTGALSYRLHPKASYMATPNIGGARTFPSPTLVLAK